MLVRETALKLISSLDSWKKGEKEETTNSAFTAIHLLTGPPGNGKSTLLNYAAMYGLQNQWITIFVPNTWAIMHDSLVLAPSVDEVGKVDQHDTSILLLKSFLAMNQSLLEKCPQLRSYPDSRYLPQDVDILVSTKMEEKRATEIKQKTHKQNKH
jgi:energy-coupling factor transporter ATP-binding protein EcfA2